MSINPISTPQNVSGVKDRDDIGSATPAYIPNTDEPEAGSSDTPDVATTTPARTPRNFGATGRPSDDPEYLANTGGDYPTDAPGGVTPDSAVPKAGDALNNGGQAVDDAFNGLNDSDFITTNSDGYETLDSARLERFMTFLAKMTSAELTLEMLVESREEISEKMMEILLEIKPDDSDNDISRDAYMKSMKDQTKISQQFVANLFKAVTNSNLELLQQRLQQYEKEKSDRGFWGDVGNFFDGGSDDIRIEHEKENELAKFNSAAKDNLHSLMTAMEAITQAISDGSDTDKGIAAALNDFDAKIEQANKHLDDYPIEDHDSGWFANTFFPEFTVLGSTPLSYFDDDEGKGFLQGILTSDRSKLVGLENLDRAQTYAQTAQMEEGQSISEILLDLSPHASKAEYAFASKEGVFNLANMFFDLTFNSLMLRIKFYNTQVQVAENINKMCAAQGWNIMSSALTVIAVAAAFIPGYGTIIACAAGLLAAGCRALGAYEASQVDDHYDMSSPEFTTGADPTITNSKNVQEAVNNAEAAEEQVTNGMDVNSLLYKSTDGFYSLNSEAMMAIEIRQKTFENIAKMMVYLNKAMRDVSRAVTSIVMEVAVKDFGDGYLLGNLDNTLHQRQLVMQAIKFQLGEVVVSKNIARSREIMADKALGALGASGAGAAIGAIVGYIISIWVPGATGLISLIGIGSAMGASLYSVLNGLFSDDSSFNNKFDMKSDDFGEQLAARRRNAENSTVAEDKLALLEDNCYQDLMTNGYVETGDGYHGVDFALVGNVYNQLMKIETLRQMLSQLRAAQSKLSADIMQETVGAAANSNELGVMVGQGAFSLANQIVSSIVSTLSEKAQVMNRQRDAEKELTMAAVSLGVEVVVGGAGVAGSLGAYGPAMTSISQSATMSAVGLISGAANLYESIKSADSGYGKYESYSTPDKVVKDMKGDKAKADSNDPFDSLDTLENQIYLQAGQNLAETMNGATEVMDGEQSGILSSRMRALSNLRKTLMTLISGQEAISGTVRARVGMGSRHQDNLGALAVAEGERAQNMLNSAIQIVEIIIERNNQMSQATRAAWTQAIGMAISVVSITLGAISASNDASAKTEDDAARATGQGQPVTPAASVPPAAATEQPAAATEAAPAPQSQPTATKPVAPTEAPKAPVAPAEAPKTPATATTGQAPAASPKSPVVAGKAAGQPAPKAPVAAAPVVGSAKPTDSGLPKTQNAAGVEKTQGDHIKARDAFKHSANMYGVAATLANIASTFMNYGTGKIFDEAAAQKHSHIQSSSPLDANRTSSKGKAEGPNSKGDIFDTLNNLEAEANQSEVMISAYSTKTGAEIAAQRAEELIKTLMSVIETSARLMPGDKQSSVYAKETHILATPSLTSAEDAKNWQDQMTRISEKVKSGEVTPQKAEKLIKDLAMRLPEDMKQSQPMKNLQAQVEQASKAASAMVNPNAVKQPSPPTKFQSTEKPTANTKGAMDYANKLIADIENKIQEVQKKATTVANNSDVSAKTVVATDGEKAATPEEQIKQLEAQKAQLMQKLDELNGVLRELNDVELPVIKDKVAKLTVQVDARIDEINTLLQSNPSPADQKALRAELKMLEVVKPRLEKDQTGLKAKIAEVKGQINNVRGEVMGLNRQIAMLQRENTKTEEDKKNAKIGSRTAVATVTGQARVEGVAKTGQRLGHKQQETFKSAADRAEQEEALVMGQNGGGKIGGYSC